MVWVYWTILLLSTLAAVAVGVRVRAGLAITGPDRLGAEEPAMPYLLALGVGLIAWAMIPAVYLHAMRSAAPATAPASHAIRAQLTPLETVTLANFASFGPFLLMMGVYIIIRPLALRRLGLAAGDLRRAIVPTLAGAVIAIPAIMWVAHFCGWLYRRFGIEHPLRHELLEILNASPDATVRLLMLSGAVIGAPLFEELLFRGHIQTLLVDALSGRLQRRSESGGSLDVPPSAALRWSAVVITSALFAGIHAWWSVPAIFVLSLCLGYAYERTGNLYVPILIHLLFNSSNILFSLYAPT